MKRPFLRWVISGDGDAFNLRFPDSNVVRILDTAASDGHCLGGTTSRGMASYSHSISVSSGLTGIFRDRSTAFPVGAVCHGAALVEILLEARTFYTQTVLGPCGHKRRIHTCNIPEKKKIPFPRWKGFNVINCHRVACWPLLRMINMGDHGWPLLLTDGRPVDGEARSRPLGESAPLLLGHVYPPPCHQGHSAHEPVVPGLGWPMSHSVHFCLSA